jgi:hypothetical protein
MGIHSDAHLALLAVRNTMSWRYLLILTLDLYGLLLLGLDVQLGGLDTEIDLCFHQPLLRCPWGLYTPRKYQAVSVELQGEYTHDMDTDLCHLSGN